MPGRPYLISPVTLDHAWLLDNLERVQIGDIEDGTAIGSALASGLNRLRNQTAKSKIVILMTDGQNNSGQITPITAAEAARALGIKVYTIGIGVRGEAPFPVTDAFGRRRIVMEKVDVDEDTLRRIAAATGARFYRATDTDSLNRIYAEIDKLEKTAFTVHSYERWQELFRLAGAGGAGRTGTEPAVAVHTATTDSGMNPVSSFRATAVDAGRADCRAGDAAALLALRSAAAPARRGILAGAGYRTRRTLACRGRCCGPGAYCFCLAVLAACVALARPLGCDADGGERAARAGYPVRD